MVTVEPPVLVTFSDKDVLLPTVTLPKLRLVGLAPRSPGEMPIPDKGRVWVGLEALEVRVTEPLALPADEGANQTLKEALCPAVRVTGAVIPLRLKPVPLAATCEMVTLVPPVLVTVSDRDCLLPTVTLPKSWLDGLSVRTPGTVTAPVPESVSSGTVFDASLLSESVPLKVPVVLGVN